MRGVMRGATIGAVLSVIGCSSGSPEIPLPPPGHSVVVHGFAEVVGRGSGPLALCVHQASPNGPKRCGATMLPGQPAHNPRCASSKRVAPVTATLVREPSGGFHWVITELDGQPC